MLFLAQINLIDFMEKNYYLACLSIDLKYQIDADDETHLDFALLFLK